MPAIKGVLSTLDVESFQAFAKVEPILIDYLICDWFIVEFLIMDFLLKEKAGFGDKEFTSSTYSQTDGF